MLLDEHHMHVTMLTAMIVFNLLGTASLKCSTLSGALTLLFTGYGLQVISMLIYPYLMPHYTLRALSCLSSSCTLVASTTMGWFAFNEPLTPWSAVGLLFFAAALMAITR